MEPDEFFATCESEGLGYTLADYFSPTSLATITDDEVREAALRASQALIDLTNLGRARGFENI